MSPRNDGRPPDGLRPVAILPDFLIHPDGSVLIECGNTRVICTASVEEKVPQFLRGAGSGWITSEYGMLPGSTGSRMTRESSKGRPSGRTQEIQRLIGRSLRSIVDLKALGERTLWIDCDVIQADGGTRTASITGSFVALALALERLLKKGQVAAAPLRDYVAAVSVGIVDGQLLLDLNYVEDSTAEVDMNIVMTGSGRFVEVQGTAEGVPFSREQMDQLIELGRKGIRQLVHVQQEVLRSRFGESFDFRKLNFAAAAGNQ